jgi:lipopolysaccharide export system permease protein
MKKRIYKYFFSEFVRNFAVVLFASVAVIWTVQAVNFLDLVTEDGHAFKIYMIYSLLTLTKVTTKLIPFSFLAASILTILKFDKDNELIILWTSGLNKIHIVNLMFRISIIIMLLQLIMSSIINPETLNISRSLLKNSELQFVSSLLKERQFNDAVKSLTIFVDKKNDDGTYENIFIRDDGQTISKISSSSTIFAKSGYVIENQKKLLLLDGNIQKIDNQGNVSIIKFQETTFDLSGLSTKTTSEPKIQETSTKKLIDCMLGKSESAHNCAPDKKNISESKIEINKRFGMPIFLPLIGLICCFLLSSRREKKIHNYYKYIFFLIGFLILVSAEISVRYSGISFTHTMIYYFLPIVLLPLVYLYLIITFKYENLN